MPIAGEYDDVAGHASSASVSRLYQACRLSTPANSVITAPTGVQRATELQKVPSAPLWPRPEQDQDGEQHPRDCLDAIG